MRLTILGGGGFRVPLVYGALLGDRHERRVDELVLHDVDAGRLGVIERVLRQMAAGRPDAPTVTATTSLDEALEGTDFVFSAIRVGGLEGRTCDERVALDLGVLGQETTGPGGLAYGLRTLPVALDIDSRVARATPPRCRPEGDGRTKAPSRLLRSDIRVRSPRIDPPVRRELGSTATTPTCSPASTSRDPRALMKVDLPAPGTPLMPTRIADPVYARSRPSSSLAASRCSARVDSTRVIARAIDPEDRRRARFSLTDAGKQIDRTKKGTVEEAVRRALDRADEATRAKSSVMLSLLVDELTQTS